MDYNEILQRHKGNPRCHRIAEKRFFHRRKISGQPDKKGHQRKKESCHDDEQDSLFMIIHLYHPIISYH